MAIRSTVSRRIGTGAQAMRAGKPGPERAGEVDERYPGLALVLDGGGAQKVQTSVIDLTSLPPKVLREGIGDVSEFADD